LTCGGYFATVVCAFPGCSNPAPAQAASPAEGVPALCLEHDAYLFYAPGEFERMWAEREPGS
jgi:hypothetical protein